MVRAIDRGQGSWIPVFTILYFLAMLVPQHRCHAPALPDVPSKTMKMKTIIEPMPGTRFHR
jgi:hypothetical protein